MLFRLKACHLWKGLAILVFVLALPIFIFSWQIALGAIWGGHLGANAVIKNGDKWMKKIFIAGMALAAMKLLYDSILS